MYALPHRFSLYRAQGDDRVLGGTAADMARAEHGHPDMLAATNAGLKSFSSMVSNMVDNQIIDAGFGVDGCVWWAV